MVLVVDAATLLLVDIGAPIIAQCRRGLEAELTVEELEVFGDAKRGCQNDREGAGDGGDLTCKDHALGQFSTLRISFLISGKSLT